MYRGTIVGVGAPSRSQRRFASSAPCLSALGLLLLLGLAPAAQGSAILDFGPQTNVSNTTQPSTKGRLEIAVDTNTFEKVFLVTYTDGPNGAADVFTRISLDEGGSWLPPINLSNTAGQINSVGSPGDSFKPEVDVRGDNVVVVWLDTYCPGGAQGSYMPGGVLTAFFCVYAARSFDTGRTWQPAEQLTNGAQDAFNTSTFASDAGFALAWQEDPLGLQPGEGQGPGDGGSGAMTSPGTDIYYTALTTAGFESSLAFPASTEVSDNFANTMGSPAASRAQLRLVGSTALLAYEETRGGMGVMGKDVIYHSFSFTAPPANAPGDVLNETATENCRRVRLIAQGAAAAGPSDTRVLALWRQGEENQGGPADVILRRSVGGVDAGDFQPAVNLTSPNLDDPTGAIPEDNARAHRALLRGDFVAFVYNYTPDDVAAMAQMATYDTFIRRSFDGGTLWGPPENLSNLTDFSILSGEPRLVGTPSTIPSGEPQDIQNLSTFFVAWGTHTNDGQTTPLDLFARGTKDGGQLFGPVALLASGPSEQAEAQLRSNPAGSRLCAVWEDDATGDHDIFFRCAAVSLAPPIPTLGTIGLVLLGLALLFGALRALRRSRHLA